MGLSIFKVSSCSCFPQPVPTPPNPDPSKFKILRMEQKGRFLVAEVEYVGCTNFEGRKILIYEGVAPWQLRKAAFLDPHFCEKGSHPIPVARFEPTDRGWRYAVLFCRNAT